MSHKKAVEVDFWDINVTGRNVLVTEAMKNYAMDKISKIDRLSNRISHVNVVMDIQRWDQRVDIILTVDNTKIKSSAHSDDMYASIDKAVDRLVEQIKRYKERIQHNHRRPEVPMEEIVYSPSDDIVQFNDDIEEESNRALRDSFPPRQVVKQESKPLKTLTTDEAIIKMELSGDPFMIFRSEEDCKIKVIYLRSDGNFGIIQPEK